MIHKHFMRIAEGLANYWKTYTVANCNREALPAIHITTLGAAGILVFISTLNEEDPFFTELLLMTQKDYVTYIRTKYLLRGNTGSILGPIALQGYTNKMENQQPIIDIDIDLPQLDLTKRNVRKLLGIRDEKTILPSLLGEPVTSTRTSATTERSNDETTTTTTPTTETRTTTTTTTQPPPAAATFDRL